MTARLILPGGAPHHEWLEARRHGITASEIAAVLGLSPWESPYSLYYRKLGELPGQDDTLAMALGRHLESFVAGEFADYRTDLVVRGDGRTLYAHPDRPWQLATPDRAIYSRDLHPRSASPYSSARPPASHDGWGDDGSADIPIHYRCQLLWQMDVLGVDTGYVACLFLPTRQIRTYQIDLDGQARRRPRRHAERGRTVHVPPADNDPPPVDWAPATTAALKALHPAVKDEAAIIGRKLGRQYATACRNLDLWKQRHKHAQNLLLERIRGGNRAVLPDGTLVATRQAYDRKAYQVKATTVVQLRPAKPPQDTA